MVMEKRRVGLINALYHFSFEAAGFLSLTDNYPGQSSAARILRRPSQNRSTVQRSITDSELQQKILLLFFVCRILQSIEDIIHPDVVAEVKLRAVSGGLLLL